MFAIDRITMNREPIYHFTYTWPAVRRASHAGAVLQRATSGLPTISVRTAEVYRARVFDKTEAKSAVDLTYLLRRV